MDDVQSKMSLSADSQLYFNVTHDSDTENVKSKGKKV